MKKFQLMERITKVTYLHIGKQWKGRAGMQYFVVLNSNPNEQKPVWMGVACWLLQLPLLMGIILGGLAIPTTLAEGYDFKWVLLAVGITLFSLWAMKKVENLFEKRPSWNKEDYIPTQEEWDEWDRWVHCEEEYGAWSN